MAPELRKYIKVWVEKRKNPPKSDGTRSTSYTLEWVEFGRRRFQSLGPCATKGFADAMAREKESQLNSASPHDSLIPLTWNEFREKFLDKYYPGHDLAKAERQKQESKWSNAIATMRDERHVLDSFSKIAGAKWCHEITSEDREAFIQLRMSEVESGDTIDKNLGVLRHLFNLLEEWNHRGRDSNPFAGRGNATIGGRRRKQMRLERERLGNVKPEFYSIDQVKAILIQADKEAGEQPSDWGVKRLRALVYFVAYTGARIKEVLFLEWKDIDFQTGVANLFPRLENMLKTEGSAAPVGLADPLLKVLSSWQTVKRCSWVFPNLRKDSPWITGGKGYKPLDQLKELAGRASVEHATWKMFRDTLTTLGKSQFGLTEAQLQAMLRHTTTKTQKHYTHDELLGLRTNANAFDFGQRNDVQA